MHSVNILTVRGVDTMDPSIVAGGSSVVIGQLLQMCLQTVYCGCMYMSSRSTQFQLLRNLKLVRFHV